MTSAYICNRGFNLSTLKTATELFTGIKSNISNMPIFYTICSILCWCAEQKKNQQQE